MSGNLPFLLSSFIGRSQELADVRRLLTAHRLVTLTGAGGAGKTRLSLAIAAEVTDQFPDGIFLVELAGVTEPALVSQTIATAVSPGFHLNQKNAAALANLCHKLDGLPLAIELAAAQSRHLSVAQIATRLESSLDLLAAKDPTLPPRQQTLTAAIDWSYNALSAEEARLLRYLSVFKGGFTLTAVVSVISKQYSFIGEQKSENWSLMTDPLTTLSQLIDKSLVVVASREPEPMYRLLEVVRQYAWEKLVAAEDDTAVPSQHAHYYYQLVQTAAPHICSQQRAVWQEKLEAEYDNILAALNWFADNGAIFEGGAMVWALRWFFYFRGTVSEASRRAVAFLALPNAPELTAVRARLHWCVGATFWVFGNYEQAYQTLVVGRDLAESAGDDTALAYTLTLQGLMGALTNQLDENIAMQQEAIRLFKEIGDRWGEALALYWLADTLRLRREHASAMTYFEQSQQLFHRIGDDWGISLSLQGQGSTAYRLGNYSLARAQLEEALHLRRVSQDDWLTAQTLATLATVLQDQNERTAAVAHFQEADKLYKEIGDDYGHIYALFKLGKLAQQAGDPITARIRFQDCLTLAEAFEHPGRVADCRSALAQLDGGTTAVPATQPALYITAFGPGEVRRADGSVIASSDWSYARVKELFFYLVESGPQTKAQIGLDFWPEVSPARLRRNLHDTLYQLRKTLGSPDWIVYENGRYTFNHALPCQYDIADFSRYLQTPTIENLQQASALYQADFLTGFDGEWCLLRRENLRQAFLAALMQLGELLAADGRYPQAAAVYRQAISHDNLLETAHREFIHTLIHMGETAQAARQYQALTQLLADELGVAPSEETAVLWQHLQQK